MIIQEELYHRNSEQHLAILTHKCEHCKEVFQTPLIRKFSEDGQIIKEKGLPKYCPFCGKEISNELMK